MYYQDKYSRLLEHEYLKRPEWKDFLSHHRFILQSNRSINSSTPIDGRRCFSAIASRWLQALPNAGLGQVMDPAEFRVALSLRLLVPVSSASSPCRAEGCCRVMDRFGYHALSCGRKR